MATKYLPLASSLPKSRFFSSSRTFSNGRIIYNKPYASSQGERVSGDVPGLSSAVVKETSEPVGPGACKSGEYKCPEYYNFNELSYFEAEVEMAQYRLPQPDSKRKWWLFVIWSFVYRNGLYV